jgi:hypothetical protein
MDSVKLVLKGVFKQTIGMKKKAGVLKTIEARWSFPFVLTILVALTSEVSTGDSWSPNISPRVYPSSNSVLFVTVLSDSS